jgi:voltage-dependent anion channel protein 2
LLTADRAGISITQSWNTANLLATKVELDNTFASGLKTEILSNFNPAAGNKGQKVNMHFKQPGFHGRAFVDYSAAGAIGTIADAVVSHEGVVVGGEVGYDVQKAAITKYSAAVGFTTPLYNAAVTATNSLSVFTASYYQKVNPAVEAGARAVWDSKSGSNVGLELAAKYKLDPASFAKVGVGPWIRSSHMCACNANSLLGQDQQPRHCFPRLQHQGQQRSDFRYWWFFRYPEAERGRPQARHQLHL